MRSAEGVSVFRNWGGSGARAVAPPRARSCACEVGGLVGGQGWPGCLTGIPLQLRQQCKSSCCLPDLRI